MAGIWPGVRLKSYALTQLTANLSIPVRFFDARIDGDREIIVNLCRIKSVRSEPVNKTPSHQPNHVINAAIGGMLRM